MSDLRELYQEVIVDHAKSPRHFGKLEDASQTIQGFNPLCGDKITLYVGFKDNLIDAIQFEGSGCAISTASASLMSEALESKSPEEARQMIDKFQEMVTAPMESTMGTNEMGKVGILSGVREFPVRIKCATLAWHSLKAALDGESAVVSTE